MRTPKYSLILKQDQPDIHAPGNDITIEFCDEGKLLIQQADYGNSEIWLDDEHSRKFALLMCPDLATTKKLPPKKWIKEKVELILKNDGPDGHTDGSNYITALIMAILDGNHQKWSKYYNEHLDKKHAARDKYDKEQLAKLEKDVKRITSKSSITLKLNRKKNFPPEYL